MEFYYGIAKPNGIELSVKEAESYKRGGFLTQKTG